MSNSQLDRLDIRILKMLSNNGRKAYLEIARECNVSGAAIHQRIAKLNATGVLTGVETLFNTEILGYTVCAFISLTVSIPVDEAVAKLKEIPEIVDCNIVMGEDQLLVKLYAKSYDHLSEIINDRIRPIGVVRMRPALSLKQGFHRPLPVELSDNVK